MSRKQPLRRQIDPSAEIITDDRSKLFSVAADDRAVSVPFYFRPGKRIISPDGLQMLFKFPFQFGRTKIRHGSVIDIQFGRPFFRRGERQGKKHGRDGKFVSEVHPDHLLL